MLSSVMTTVSLDINWQAFMAMADWDVVGNEFQGILQNGSTQYSLKNLIYSHKRALIIKTFTPNFNPK